MTSDESWQVIQSGDNPSLLHATQAFNVDYREENGMTVLSPSKSLDYIVSAKFQTSEITDKVLTEVVCQATVQI